MATRTTKTQQRRRLAIPLIRQTAGTDCGPACLAMVLGAYGKHIPLREIRDHMGFRGKGVNALAIVRTAKHYGLRARGVRVALKNLPSLTPPVILHWRGTHFVILGRWLRDMAEIIDPGSGRYKITSHDFALQFSGVAIIFEPGPTFE